MTLVEIAQSIRIEDIGQHVLTVILVIHFNPLYREYPCLNSVFRDWRMKMTRRKCE